MGMTLHARYLIPQSSFNHYTYVFRKLINSLRKGEYIKERKSQRTLGLSFRKSRHIFLNGSIMNSVLGVLGMKLF